MASRKDYVAMADIIVRHRETYANVVGMTYLMDNLTRSVADHFAMDSAAFDYTKFYLAAGMGDRR